jgi:3-dehydroquinate synthase
MKASIVAADEQETGIRTLLNLGHTFGHAIEAHAGYGAWLHGEAVAAGMCIAMDLSARLGLLPAAEADRARALIERAGLPTRPPAGLAPSRFLELMWNDKKVKAGRLRVVLLRSIGEAVIRDQFEPTALDATLEHFCTPA